MENLICRPMTTADMEQVTALYMAHYNDHEGGCWTAQTTARRILQVLTRMDSLCRILERDGEILGFAMGYMEQFDDIQAYDLVEIVIRHDQQGQGLGTAFMTMLERDVKAAGMALIQLQAVNDAMHHHFYGKLGYTDTNSFVSKGKWL